MNLTLGVRGKLFLTSMVLVLFGVGATAVVLEGALREWNDARLESTLARNVRAARIAAEHVELSSIDEVDALADRLGKEISERVTIIGADGRVIGDSAVARESIPSVENHGQRTEVIGALAKGEGFARRKSATVGGEMFYHAARLEQPGGAVAVVRIAMSAKEVEELTTRVRWMLFIAAMVGLAVALFMSGLASELMSRALRDLVRRTRALVEDRGGRRSEQLDEIGWLAGRFKRMSGELEDSVAALAQERDRLEAMLASLSDAVIALDGSGHVTLANRGAEALFGLSAPPIGRPLVEITRHPELLSIVDRTTAGGSSSAEIDLETKHGRRRILVRATREKKSGGVVVALEDVSEMRRLESVRRDFVANVSHELRTPVSIIRANAETLSAIVLDDPKSSLTLIDALVRHSDRLSNLVGDLLDLSRLEAGAHPLEPEVVSIAEAARRASDVLAGAARAKTIEVKIEIGSDLLADADGRAVEQVLFNLIDNAVKYTPAGGHVAVRAEEEGDFLRVEVADDGPGIEPRHRARVFERFYRVDPGRSREMGGTGLGLSIVKHLVDAMGGSVGVDPASPNGSRFWFKLPKRRA
jgi:two-component system, OmpR family, phosphate regulon sensor histidine kinase PhoR